MVTTREELRQALARLPADADDARIAVTRRDLERRSFSPAFLLPVRNFLSMKRADLEKAVDQVLTADDQYLAKRLGSYSSDPERIRWTQVSLLIYYYDLLSRLRMDVPEAWDEINELYEDD